MTYSDSNIFAFSDTQLQQSSISTLFTFWLACERQRRDTNPKIDVESAEKILDTQSVILGILNNCYASCIEDVFHKLTIWRWDQLPDSPDLASCDRGELIAYSAYQDLSRLLNAPNAEDFSVL